MVRFHPAAGWRLRISDWLDAQWYQGHPVNWALKILSGPFECAVRLRRWAYMRGIRRSIRLSVPVIVIGNLSVGGTGKTPLTIWLVNALKESGWRPGVVSRGYGGKRRSNAPVSVMPDSDPAGCGDEPVLIAAKSGVPVVVSRDRIAAGGVLIRDYACNVIVADDGLQHYRLERDIEILLIDGERQFGNGLCLPAGPLREPMERAQAADFVIQRGGLETTTRFRMDFALTRARNLKQGQLVDLTAFRGTEVVAVAGIAHPDSFFRCLYDLGLNVDSVAFPDHHRYEASDFAFAAGKPVLMTEKDAVKCGTFADSSFWAVPADAQLQAEFRDLLLKKLEQIADGQAPP